MTFPLSSMTAAESPLLLIDLKLENDRATAASELCEGYECSRPHRQTSSLA